MKVAVLFAGRIQAYETVTNTLQGFKNKYSPTYYCSLNEPEYTEYIDEFCKLLDISRERMNIEPTPDPGFLNRIANYTSKSPKQAYSMFYHENKAFTLIENDVIQNNKQFDCVVYSRADIDSHEILQLEMPKANTIYVPDGEAYYGINDRLAYGNYESMKKYCSLIDTMKSEESMHRINPEGMIKRHLENEKLEIAYIKYDTRLSNMRKKPDDVV